MSNKEKSNKCDWVSKNPQIAVQWHPVKNDGLRPTDISSNCKEKVWWYLPYDDPETGKHHDFEWRASIGERVRSCRCPYLSGRAVWPGYNDLVSKRPDLAKEWHPTKNGELKPTEVSYGSSQKVWWYYPYDDPETGKHHDFEWRSLISDRVNGNGCPYLSGKAVWPGYNDLATRRPDLAKEWHPTKNEELKPNDVTCGTHKKVWWYWPYDDPKTGKHFDFEWMASIANRVNGNGCPYLSSQAVWPGYNDLASNYPELAVQWHPTKNGNLEPTEVTCYGKKKVWWYLPYDDPKTGKHFVFEWQATISHRTRGHKCPYLSGQRIWVGYNDLATTKPCLAKEWHPSKNGRTTPEMVTSKSEKKVWWYLPYDDPKTEKHFDFEWREKICNRANGRGCPFLSGRGVWSGFNDLESCYPDVAKELHSTKNRKVTTKLLYKYERRKVWWHCSKCGHEWLASVVSRTLSGSKCKHCR